MGRDKRGGDYSDEPAGSPEAGAGLWKADFRPAWGGEKRLLGAICELNSEDGGRFLIAMPRAPSTKQTGLPQEMEVKEKVAQSCPTLCDSMD